MKMKGDLLTNFDRRGGNDATNHDTPPPSDEHTDATAIVAYRKENEDANKEDTAAAAQGDSSSGCSNVNSKTQKIANSSSALLQQEKRYIAHPRVLQQKQYTGAAATTASTTSTKDEEEGGDEDTTAAVAGTSFSASGGSNVKSKGAGSHPVVGGLSAGGNPTVLCRSKNRGRIVSHPNNSSCQNANPRLRGIRKNQGRIISLPDRPSSSELDEEHEQGQAESNLSEEVSTEVSSIHDDRVADVVQRCVEDGQPTPEETSTEDHQPTPAAQTNTLHDNNNDGLVAAMPVEDDHDASNLMEAQPVNQEDLDQQAEREMEDKKWKKFACTFVAVACIVLTVSLAIGLTNKKETNNVADNKTPAPTGSPTTRLPPMENLEILFDELPEKTKESLYNDESPQHEAWNWLLNHPHLSTLEEWRKKQIFAMVTFFHSFEGPNWPEGTRSRWLNTSTNECSWVLNDAEVAFWTQKSAETLGPDAYGYQDFQPCNKDGELQTILLSQLFLTTDVNPSIPPEIELLVSLRILGIIFSQINAKLSDLLVPELIHLPNLAGLNFQGSGVSGIIPKDIGLMTGVKHFIIGGNRLFGTIPSEIGEMASLEFFSMNNMEDATGALPSEIGLMTSLTGLEISKNSLTGNIPIELSLLTNMKRLSLDHNRLKGSIPSDLGLMTSATVLSLAANHLTGSIPSELASMTSMKTLSLRNNALNGLIPSELGLMMSTIEIFLGNDIALEGTRNDFSGSLPEELWMLSHLLWLFLPNLPNLQGSIPTDIMLNLTMFRLEGSPHLSCTIPEEICFLQEEPIDEGTYYTFVQGQALDFDCSDWLCGCDCECVGGDNSSGTNRGGWQWN